jgi:hypothetical protein
MADAERRPAYYAARPGGWQDWWTLLHPPYTAWHLSYVVIGACLAPKFDATRLVATILAFFAAVGVGAHAIDELHGRPLQTQIPGWALSAAATVGVAAAIGLGAIGVERVGIVLVPFIIVGPLLVVAYNAELFGGIVHTNIGFALSWGSFPVVVGYVAQAGTIRLEAVLAAAAAAALSMAQRTLSASARALRRQVTSIDGVLTLDDGTSRPITHSMLRTPLEQALNAVTWSQVGLATALVLTRLHEVRW